MGLTTEERDFLRKAFAAAFSPTLALEPGELAPTVGIVDFMKYVKVLVDPEGRIHGREAIVEYFVGRVRDLLLDVNSTLRDLIIMVDMKPPVVKRLVAHKKRYADGERLPSPGDRSKRYLDDAGRAQNWRPFCSNYHLLQRELYPELFNAFMSCRFFTPAPGQTLILSGFPGRTALVEGAPHKLEVKLWSPHELPITKRMEREDRDLYCRTYLVRGFGNGEIQREEWIAARNNIAESDVRMFWFDHFYQQHHIVFYTGDGDVLSLGVAYAFERRTGIHLAPTPGARRKYEFRNRHTVCLPYLKKQKSEGLADALAAPRQREEWVNLNLLYALMREYPPLVEAGVQNPVMTMVFLIILSGSDFVNKAMHGLGSQTIIWATLLQNASIFSHMVMCSEGVVGATRTQRTLVIDEDAFRLFVRYCYLAAHEPHRKKLGVKRLTYEQLRERTQHMADMKTPQKDTRYHLPDSNTIRRNCRATLWNLLYWRNGPLGYVPDPFEQWQALPYFPYRRNARGKGEQTDVVSPKPKPVDRTMEQHLYRFRQLELKRTE